MPQAGCCLCRLEGPHRATLPGIAFEGASKRNRPHLEVGALVHAKVLRADKHSEPEISCCGGSKGWATKESLFGPLEEGYMIQTSLDLAESLLHDNSAVLLELERIKLPFEIATGHNGRVWIKSKDPAQTIFVSNVIAHSEFASADEAGSSLGDSSERGSTTASSWRSRSGGSGEPRGEPAADGEDIGFVVFQAPRGRKEAGVKNALRSFGAS